MYACTKFQSVWIFGTKFAQKQFKNTPVLGKTQADGFRSSRVLLSTHDFLLRFFMTDEMFINAYFQNFSIFFLVKYIFSSKCFYMKCNRNYECCLELPLCDSPCQHGRCVGQNKCICDQGFEGKYCEKGKPYHAC